VGGRRSRKTHVGKISKRRHFSLAYHMCVILPQGELSEVDRTGGTVQTAENARARDYSEEMHEPGV